MILRLEELSTICNSTNTVEDEEIDNNLTDILSIMESFIDNEYIKKYADTIDTLTYLNYNGFSDFCQNINKDISEKNTDIDGFCIEMNQFCICMAYNCNCSDICFFRESISIESDNDEPKIFTLTLENLRDELVVNVGYTSKELKIIKDTLETFRNRLMCYLTDFNYQLNKFIESHKKL